jgi:hypothetical protein
VDVLHVFFGGAGVAKALLAHGAAVPARVPAASCQFFLLLKAVLRIPYSLAACIRNLHFCIED